jgi:hypothetical protein
MDYNTLINGQPVKNDPDSAVFEACCDCSLVHLVTYSITDDGKVRVTKYRDDWETNRVRAAERKKARRRRAKGA